METQAAQTISQGHLIERIDGAQPLYFSEKVGRDFGSPQGGWSDNPADATVFDDEDKAQHALDTYLQSIAPQCKVVLR